MRFLKFKINRALEAQKAKSLTQSLSPSHEDKATLTTTASSPQVSQDSPMPCSELFSPEKTKKRNRRQDNKKSCRPPSSTKNITINFGKAIAKFAASQTAIPYLEHHIQEKRVSYGEFLNFVNNAKNGIRSIDTFRNLLLVDINDSSKQTALKDTFKAVAEAFIKFFSVNWIIHGKVTHKMIYLKYRYKMLRRIQNPEGFTFVKKRTGKRK